MSVRALGSSDPIDAGSGTPLVVVPELGSPEALAATLRQIAAHTAGQVLVGCADARIGELASLALAGEVALLGTGEASGPEAALRVVHARAPNADVVLVREGVLVGPGWLDGLKDAASSDSIVMTASGCGATVREYGQLLQHDPAYRDKAARISAMTKDLCEVVPETAAEKLSMPRRVAFQSPCSLQHGQQVRGKVEALLQAAGYELSPVADGHLCCGSAGTYSILQPELSGKLRERKLAALCAGGPAGGPECIATANIGCLMHLQAGTGTPVRHWIQLLDE